MKLVKQINILFLIIVVISALGTLFVSLLATESISIPILANLLISQGMILVPGLVFILLNQGDISDLLNYKKIKIISVILIIALTELTLPITYCVNMLSQLFVKNEVLSISGEVLDLPFSVMIFIIGILGPFCEEFVFRALINNGLKAGTGRVIMSGVVSACFFGLMHMNINQCCYAFVLGMIFSIVNVALESNWPSFIMHAVVNIQNVIMLYAVNTAMEKTGIDIQQVAGKEVSKATIIIMAGFFMIVAVFTTALAALLLYGICIIEGKENKIKALIKEPFNTENKTHLITLPGIIGMVICIALMIVAI